MTHERCGSYRAGDTLVETDCGGLADTFQSAAMLQIPALAGATLVLATAYGLFAARRW
jgi:hypothetical protein